jgi:hypothetical protein
VVELDPIARRQTCKGNKQSGIRLFSGLICDKLDLETAPIRLKMGRMNPDDPLGPGLDTQ